VEACASGDWEMVQGYIESGSNLEGRSQDGKTPFLYACIKGNMNIVKLLMRKEAKVSARDHVRTPKIFLLPDFWVKSTFVADI